jgi:SDR family mycofactocin-dependent oxidoreductase
MTESGARPARFTGKVALVTGAARGQGLSHALRFAEEGADVIILDAARPFDFAPYEMPTADDLAEATARLRSTGRRVVAGQIDVRDRDDLKSFVDRAVGELGRLDIVCANAAVVSESTFENVTPDVWDTTIGINLTGVFNTCAATAPHLIAGGGGSIVIIGSTAARRGLPFLLPYVAAKHGLVGLARTLAVELGNRNVRVNVVHPGAVDTHMGHLGTLPDLLADRPDLAHAFDPALPGAAMDPNLISNAVLYLASDEASRVTGAELTVDSGATLM